MGCCGSTEVDSSGPMRGDQVVGREGGTAVNRDEARAKAAAAAEARMASQQTRGQVGATSKMKAPVEDRGYQFGEKKAIAAHEWD